MAVAIFANKEEYRRNVIKLELGGALLELNFIRRLLFLKSSID
jgi:hypothetical protein